MGDQVAASLAGRTKQTRIAYTARLEERRDQLIRDVKNEFGVQLYPGRPGRPEIVVRESDFQILCDAVMNDRRATAISRGYYLGLGGELDVVTAPDWTCDPGAVAKARLAAVICRPFRRLL